MYNIVVLRSWILFFVVPLIQALSITIPSQAQANTPTRVTWSLDPGDPTQWDFRLVKDGMDVGLAAANVKAGSAQNGNGESVVVFPGVGNFVLAAVAGSDHNIIGQSLTTQVVNTLSSSSTNPTSTSTSTSPSVSITTIIPSAPPINLKAQSRPNVPAIVGGVLGALIFILLVLLLYLPYRRRRQSRNNSNSNRPEMLELPAPAPTKRDRKSWLQRLTSKPTTPREVEVGRGPRAPKPSTPLPRTIIICPPRTERQQMIDDQIASLLEQLTDIQREGELGRMRDSWRTSIITARTAGTGLSGGASTVVFNTGGTIPMVNDVRANEVGFWETEAESREHERKRRERVEEVWRRIRRLRELKEGEWAVGDCDEVPEEVRGDGIV